MTVTRNFGQGFTDRLGVATLTKLDDRIVAEWDFPSDKLPAFPLYPAVGGTTKEAEGEQEIKSCVINQIAICTTPNSDPDILSLQEQNPGAPTASSVDH